MIPTEMWGRTSARIFGGANEFYGQALLVWSYNFYRLQDFV